jgi:hypothetical protein
MCPPVFLRVLYISVGCQERLEGILTASAGVANIYVQRLPFKESGTSHILWKFSALFYFLRVTLLP